MSDNELRALERRYHETKDEQDGAALVRARLRSGALSPEMLLHRLVYLERAVALLIEARETGGGRGISHPVPVLDPAPAFLGVSFSGAGDLLSYLDFLASRQMSEQAETPQESAPGPQPTAPTGQERYLGGEPVADPVRQRCQRCHGHRRVRDCSYDYGDPTWGNCPDCNGEGLRRCGAQEVGRRGDTFPSCTRARGHTSWCDIPRLPTCRRSGCKDESTPGFSGYCSNGCSNSDSDSYLWGGSS